MTSLWLQRLFALHPNIHMYHVYKFSYFQWPLAPVIWHRTPGMISPSDPSQNEPDKISHRFELTKGCIQWLENTYEHVEIHAYSHKHAQQSHTRIRPTHSSLQFVTWSGIVVAWRINEWHPTHVWNIVHKQMYSDTHTHIQMHMCESQKLLIQTCSHYWANRVQQRNLIEFVRMCVAISSLLQF